MANSSTLGLESVLESFTAKSVFSGICSGAMMVGGIVPYVPQYREIRRTLNADGFSLYVCLALLIANTLRIVFWFGHQFELPLLFQSIIMNMAMLAMIHLCIKIRNQTQIIPTKPHYFTEQEKQVDWLGDKKSFHSSPPTHTRNFWDFDARYFWEWTDFLSYLEFLATFTAMAGILMYFFVNVVFVVELIGFLAVFTEAMLGAPQFYRNLQKKSTIGMSKKMVLLWALGDVFKTVYFVVREAPLQFWICGILQVLIDFAILLQVLLYKVASSPVKLLIKGTQHIS